MLSLHGHSLGNLAYKFQGHLATFWLSRGICGNGSASHTLPEVAFCGANRISEHFIICLKFRMSNLPPCAQSVLCSYTLSRLPKAASMRSSESGLLSSSIYKDCSVAYSSITYCFIYLEPPMETMQLLVATTSCSGLDEKYLNSVTF